MLAGEKVCSRRFILRKSHKDKLWNRFKKRSKIYGRCHLRDGRSNQEGWAEQPGAMGKRRSGKGRGAGAAGGAFVSSSSIGKKVSDHHNYLAKFGCNFN